MMMTVMMVMMTVCDEGKIVFFTCHQKCLAKKDLEVECVHYFD